MTVALFSPEMQKALNWINSGDCVVLDNDALDKLGRTMGTDWETLPDGERRPAPFSREVMRRFLSELVLVDGFTLRKTDSVWTTRSILVSPSLMRENTFNPDETTLAKAILVAKRVFEGPSPTKYEISGKPEFMRDPTVLSSAVAELKISAENGYFTKPQRTHGVRFLDFKA